ncbi:MAG: TonB-dependent receptor [Alphaproteobacteria bacterium]|nr:TonB-dependent receptor [Alphaproteobacteria bacterium]MDE2629525.1 TonB-dependent receptor [Alphaproteobacteria bacterium]
MEKQFWSVKSAVLLAGASLAALAWAAPAAAQTSPPAGDQTNASTSLETVTVTARRREESAKDVPISITAFSAEQLNQTGAVDITALQQSTPNLSLSDARGSNSTLTAFIRGVGQQDPLWGFEPGVGLYVDDVYIARPQGAVLDVYNIDHIEVLRGPQGTLYGRNTIGGAVKYVTRRLDNVASLDLRGTVGAFNERDVVASGSLPLTDDLTVGGAFASEQHDGYGKNLITGADNYNKDVWAARATVEYTPRDDLFFRLSGDKMHDSSSARQGHRLIAPMLSNVYDTQAGMSPYNDVQTEGLSLLGEWDANKTWTFKSITAYRNGSTVTNIDFDSLQPPSLDIPAWYKDHQFTQELQALYTGDDLQVVGGLYYLNSSASGAFDTILNAFALTIGTYGKVATTSYAAFVNANYDITSRWSLSAGVRWTRDEKTGTVFRANYAGVLGSPLVRGPAAAPTLIRTNYTNSRAFEAATPSATLSYKLTPDVTGYASYGKGFKSGGFDMRGDAILTPSTTQGYKPEYVDSYEAGVKGSYFDHRLDLNLDGYYAKYADQQLTIQVAYGASVASQVENAANSHIYGFELEGAAHLSERLMANFSVGYTKGVFDKYMTYNVATHSYVDVSKTSVFQYTPEWQSYLGLSYTQPLPRNMGSLAVTADGAYRGATSFFQQPDPVLDQKAYWLFNMDAVWTSNSGVYQIGLHGQNLFDQKYRTGGYDFPGAVYGNSVIGFYGPPRTVMATLDVKI